MKIGTLSLAIVVVFGLMASAGMADSTYVGTAVLEQADGQYSSGDGGEFNVTLTYAAGVTSTLSVAAQSAPVQLASAVGAGTGTPGVDAVFQTFCIQEGPTNDVTFSPGTYYAATIESSTYNYGGEIQTLSPITAALFSAFWSGTLSTYGYDYTVGAGRSTSAAELQAAIWYSQGDNGFTAALTEALGGATPTTAESDQATAFYNYGVANEITGSVEILGLYNSQAEAEDAGSTGIDQAQLVEAIYSNHNVGNHPVPLPSAAQGIMVLCSIIGLSRVQRRARDLA